MKKSLFLLLLCIFSRSILFATVKVKVGQTETMYCTATAPEGYIDHVVFYYTDPEDANYVAIGYNSTDGKATLYGLKSKANIKIEVAYSYTYTGSYDGKRHVGTGSYYEYVTVEHSLVVGTPYKAKSEEGEDMWFVLTKLNNEWCVSTVPNNKTSTCFDKMSVEGKVTIPSTVQGFPVRMIAGNSFFFCADITEVVIPSTVQEIGKNSFIDCYGLETVVCLNPTPPTDNTPSYGKYKSSFGNYVYSTLYVPKGSKSKYETAAGWKEFSDIREIGSDGIVVSNIKLDCENKTLGIGDYLQLTATVTPSNATDNTYSWSSSNVNVATVSEHGYVIAKAAGKATIRCTANDGSGVSATCSISVKGSSPDVIASGVDGNITWSLSEDGVLTLSGNGQMKDYDPDDYQPTPWYSYVSKITSVDILDGVTSIGNCAFDKCSSMTSISIGNSMASIGNYAFARCSSLSSINIPNSVTSIGQGAFSDCIGLTSVTIPNSVTSIGNDAFYDCIGLTSVTIPNSVTSIGDFAFSGCTSLTSINIPNSVTSIGESAFYSCTSLTSINIPNSVASISENAFLDCSSLMSINIPNSVTSIDEWAFHGCTSLTSITIPNSVTSIANNAFGYCKSLTSITIPNSVTSINEWAFSGCSHLYAFIVDSSNNNYCAIDGVLYNKDRTVIICYPEGKEDSSYTIPNSVTTIGAAAFNGNSSLTSISIPNSVTSIGQFAFCYCSSLTSIDIPNSVNKIEYHTFAYCEKLSSVTIPNSVISIERYAFADCTTLSSVTSYIQNPYKLIRVFDEDTKATLYIPKGTMSLYQSTEGWDVFKSFVEIGVDSHQTINISSSGYATFYSSESAYTLPNGLSAQVVTGCSNNKLTYKTIADGSVSGIIPKATAVMLVSDNKRAGAFTLTPSESTVSYSGTNYLYGSDEATTTTASGSNYYYKLTNGNAGTDYADIFGWYWGAQNGGAFRIDGHKAWLAIPKTMSTRSAFAMDDDATVIDGVSMNRDDNVYYDMQGRRIGIPTAPGMYIINGKKVLINKNR